MPFPSSRPPLKPLAALILLALSGQAAWAQDAPAMLKPITVKGHEQAEPEDSYQKIYSKSSTGLRMEEKDTPQAITNITRQQMEDQNIQSLDDALTSVSGISVNEVDIGSRTTYRARGFNINNYKIDGLEFNGESGFSGIGGAVNMDLYEDVSVLRGANGLLGGTGDPSASISLSRKKAYREFGLQGNVELGSWRKRRLMGDINTPLSQDGDLRARLVLSGDDSHTFRDNENPRSFGLLATVTYDFSPDTSVTAGYEYTYKKHKGTSWGTNVPIWFSDGTRTDFDRSYHPVADWSYTQRKNHTWFANLEQNLGGGWHADANYSYSALESINSFGVLKANSAGSKWGLFDRETGLAYLNSLHSESEGTQHAFSLNVTGPFKLLGREHELILGFNGQRSEETSYQFSGALGNCHIDGHVPARGCQYRLDLPANWQTWNGNEYGAPQTFRTDARGVTRTTNYGPYIATRLELADNLKVILGSRYSYYKTYAYDYDKDNVKSARRSELDKKVWTPYVGLTFDVTPNHTLYTSYTDVFKLQSQRDVAGNIIKPITGASYEAGIKSSWLDDRLSSTVAVFHAKQTNVAKADDDRTVLDTGDQAYVANATGIKSTGLDLQLAGALTNRWNVYAGYTYMNVVDSSPNSSPRQDPRHSFRVSTTYRPNVLADKLTLGTSISYDSSTTSTPMPGRPLAGGGFDNSPIRQSGYMLAHVMARYDVNKNLSVTARVNNLFDKEYYREFGFYNGLIYGEPRNFMVNVQARF